MWCLLAEDFIHSLDKDLCLYKPVSPWNSLKHEMEWNGMDWQEQSHFVSMNLEWNFHRKQFAIFERAHPFLNPLYTGGLFHCYVFDESICHFRVVRSILLLFYF